MNPHDSRKSLKKYVLPDLAYEYSALEPHYAARPLELHHSKHHAGYVAGANTTLEKLATARERRNFEAINQLQKSLAFHVSGHVLHSLFWRNMSPHGGGPPVPTTCSINTRRAIGSQPSGRWSIGRTWRSAFRRYAHWTSDCSPVPH